MPVSRPQGQATRIVKTRTAATTIAHRSIATWSVSASQEIPSPSQGLERSPGSSMSSKNKAADLPTLPRRWTSKQPNASNSMVVLFGICGKGRRLEQDKRIEHQFCERLAAK
mmetsp:Transcript_13010/g.28927  ORF Transcript_13010/g.28927 Transcript_13010/m.28927 type:complete len:112 (-) Transcript_13010:79-414(-)